MVLVVVVIVVCVCLCCLICEFTYMVFVEIMFVGGCVWCVLFVA